MADARLEQVDDIPIFTINPKLVELARYGLDVADLQEWLASAIGGNTAGLIFEGDRRFELLVRFDEGIRTDLEAIGSTPIITSDGEFVPLSEVATLDYASVPNQISRENGKRRVVVTANVRERDLGSFVDEAKIKITEQVSLPAGYWLDYGGTFEQLESASQRLAIVVPATLFLILVLLVVVFGSFRDASVSYTHLTLPTTPYV